MSQITTPTGAKVTLPAPGSPARRSVEHAHRLVCVFHEIRMLVPGSRDDADGDARCIAAAIRVVREDCHDAADVAWLFHLAGVLDTLEAWQRADRGTLLAIWRELEA